MKTFYLLRHEDVHGNSGTGVVAEGIIFDAGGMCAMTWLTGYQTVTVFPNIKTVIHLHGHQGKTEVIVEGRRNRKKFDACKEKVAMQKAIKKGEEKCKTK